MNKIIIIFLLFSALCFSQNWSIVGEMKRPVAGGEIWSDQLEQSLYVLGGYSDSTQSNVNWIQSYPNWELDSMRTARFGFVVDTYQNQPIIYGGVSDELNYSAGLERWGVDFTEVFSDTNNIFNRIFSAGHTANDYIYIIGGNPVQGIFTDTLSYLVEYDLINSEITFSIDTVFALDQLPEQQMSEIIGNDIYIFGGVKNGISQDIHKFNIDTKVYEKLDIGLLEPRAGGKAVRSPFENKIFIIGGYNESLEALYSVEIFDADFYTVENGPPLNEARYNFMSGVANGEIYVMGGFDTDRNVVKSIESLYPGATTASENERIGVPSELLLYQNYPNPFNPVTTINYDIPSSSTNKSVLSVSLKVFDVIGKEVATIFDKGHYPGNYSVSFDASDLPSGIYYYQLIAGSLIQTRKMVVLR